jgi:hypothetical protein
MFFTRKFGGTQMLIGNLYSLVSTDPRRLGDCPDAVGPEWEENLAAMAFHTSLVIVGWGAHPLAAERAKIVLPLLLKYRHEDEIVCLGLTKGGAPKHPLYIPHSAELRNYPEGTIACI